MAGSTQIPSGAPYDASGDITNDGVKAYLYDAEGRVCASANTPSPGLTTTTGYVQESEEGDATTPVSADKAQQQNSTQIRESAAEAQAKANMQKYGGSQPADKGLSLSPVSGSCGSGNHNCQYALSGSGAGTLYVYEHQTSGSEWKARSCTGGFDVNAVLEAGQADKEPCGYYGPFIEGHHKVVIVVAP